MNSQLRSIAATMALIGFGCAAADAQVALLAGSVRDRDGRPIAGAGVEVFNRRGAAIAHGTTSADGTFVLRAAKPGAVRITCHYCRTTWANVVAGEPVVAIVQRYDALAQPSPTTADLRNLPYGDIASAIALRPFTLLAQSSRPYPGSQLSDRGLQPGGGLVVDAGVPTYDPVTGLSPFTAIPAGYEQAASVTGAGDAFRYGDRAGGGIVELSPFGDGAENVALLGSGAVLRVQAGGGDIEAAAGSSSDSSDARQRADLAGTLALGGDQQLDFGAGSEQEHAFGAASGSLADAQSFADVAWNVARAGIRASASIDRGAYAASAAEYPLSSAWSDTQATVSFQSPGRTAFFADASTRASSGYLDDRALGTPYIASNLAQTRLDAGVSASTDAYDLRAGAALFWLGQRGAVYVGERAAHATFVTPSLRLRLLPRRRWSANLEEGGAFTLPSFVATYAYGGATNVPYARSTLSSAELTYSDLDRVRASFEAARSDVAGNVRGTIASVGLGLTWQIAPLLCVQAWTMHVSDDVPDVTAAYGGAVAPTVDAVWLTYARLDALRIDAVYRRDLLDGAPFYHVDGDVSGPLRRGLRWYVGAEDRKRARVLDLGVRFAP